MGRGSINRVECCMTPDYANPFVSPGTRTEMQSFDFGVV